MTRKWFWVRFSNLLVPVFFILIVSCVPSSDHPLTEPDPEKLDKSVFGTWYWRDSSATGYIHLGKDEKTGMLQVYMIDLEDDGDIDSFEFSGHTSELGTDKYFNLKWIRPENEIKGYIFVKYQVDQDRMSFSLLDPNAVEKAIKEGVVAGEITEGQILTRVRVSDKPEKIRKFLAEKKGLFQEESYLKRLRTGNESR